MFSHSTYFMFSLLAALKVEAWTFLQGSQNLVYKLDLEKISTGIDVSVACCHPPPVLRVTPRPLETGQSRPRIDGACHQEGLSL